MSQRTKAVRWEVQVEKVLAFPPADVTLRIVLMRSGQETRMITPLAGKVSLAEKRVTVSLCVTLLEASFSRGGRWQERWI